VRYFAYVQVAEEEQNLWEEYTSWPTPASTSRCARPPRPTRSTRCSATCSRRRGCAWRHEATSRPSKPPAAGRATASARCAPAAADEDRAAPARAQRLDLRPDRAVPRVIRATAERYGLDTYPNQLEIITAEQMMDAYASVGMPVNYRHWSYGKEFISTEKNYKRGHMGLAYEIVINSQPLHQLPDGGEHHGRCRRW
jgi:hypothetical protein